MKTIEEINQYNVKKILSEKKIPNFYTGDVVKVGVRITEGKKERGFFIFHQKVKNLIKNLRKIYQKKNLYL